MNSQVGVGVVARDAEHQPEGALGMPARKGFERPLVGISDPGACVFVGDRPYDDVHGAKSAGMRAVLISNSDVPAFDAAEPDAVITRLAELLGHIDRWS